MRAVVTGGAGFIGSNLVDALVARGDSVLVVDDFSTGRQDNLPAKVEVLEHDVRTPFTEAAAGFAPDVCFHLAARVDVAASVARPDEDALVNVVGTVNALAAASRAGAKVVLASSGGAIYGEAPEPLTEAALRRPLSPYGCAKLAAEEYVETYSRVDGTNHAMLRLANVYGPRQVPQSESAVVGLFLLKLATGEPPRIFGDGLQTRDFVYVGDVVEAMLKAAAHGDGVYNIGTGTKTTVLSLYEHCAALAEAAAQPEFAPERSGELRDNVLDSGRASRELGWTASTPLGEGLRHTWEWAQAYIAR